MPRISSNNQVTLPVDAMRAAGLHAGDEVIVRVAGDGELVVAVRGTGVRRHLRSGGCICETTAASERS